ncbi:transposase [Streptomyces sp. NPDC059209]|uniref:transposase n=1 Tax=Streptomyces sp. NPDC059209 TaxID=3346769 RepID=UPI0036BC8C14
MPLRDAQWARIEPLLPDRMPGRGGRWRGHREVIDAIAWKFQTGSQLVHLPEKYGNWRGVYNRRGCRRSTAPGSGSSPRGCPVDTDEDLNWAVPVDSTIVRANQHAFRARKTGAPASPTTTPSAAPAEG